MERPAGSQMCTRHDMINPEHAQGATWQNHGFRAYAIMDPDTNLPYLKVICLTHQLSERL